MSHLTDHSTRIFIFQIALLMVVGRSLGELMQRVRQPAVMATPIVSEHHGRPVYD